MQERKSAIIDVSKGLLTVSLATLAAIGGATGNPVLAGITSAGLAATGPLDPLLTKLKGKKEAQLEIPVPTWWSRSDDGSWQAACLVIEGRLPSIIEATVAKLRKNTGIPTTITVQRAFIDEIANQAPTWNVSAQDRGLMAAYVAQPLLEKMSEVLRVAVAPIREDALSKEVEEISRLVKQLATEILTARVAVASAAPTAAIASLGASQATQEAQSIAELQQKWQNGNFNVYICYHRDDENEVLKIDTELKKRGVLPWFDVKTENPSRSTQSQKDEQIKKIKSAAVFIGKNAVAKWQAAEIEALINQFVERGMGVIPVFLKDAPSKPEMSVFLENFRGVDFRKQMPDPFEYLLWGIIGKKPPLQF